MAGGGGGGGGGTYGSPTSGNLPGTSPGSNPLALTGLTQSQLSAGTLGGGFTSTTPSLTDSVRIGKQYKPHVRLEGRGWIPSSTDSMSYQDAQSLPAYWYGSDPSVYKNFLAKLIMYKYPGASSDMGIPEAMSAWDDLLKMAITLNKSNTGSSKTDWSPWDILESYNRKPGSMGTHKEGDWLLDNATGERVKYVGPKTKTNKQTAIDLSDPKQVQAIAEQTLTQMIGRAPTAKELAKFKATLNGYEAEHPEITTTTDHYDDMGNVTASDVVRSGGVSDAARQSLIGSNVKGTKEYGKYQSGTTYFNALMAMVGGS